MQKLIKKQNNRGSLMNVMLIMKLQVDKIRSLLGVIIYRYCE